MKKRMCTWFMLVAFGAEALAMSPDSEQLIPQVEIKGVSGEMDGRDFVAGKIVIGKKQIEDSAAQNVSQVLRREPAITVGKNGGIGLMGLPGYTQILIDGSPADGVDPLELDLVHIEKIEIIKSATAATGPFGIAGTINIVRRKIARKALTQWQASVVSMGGARGANVSWMNNQMSLDSPLSYNWAFSVERKNSNSSSTYVQTVDGEAMPVAAIQGVRNSQTRTDVLTGSSKFAWVLDASHKLSLSPDLLYLSLDSNGTEQRRASDGDALTQVRRARSPFKTVGLPLQWDWKLDEDSQLMVKLKTSVIQANSDADGREAVSARGSHVRQQERNVETRNHFLDADFNTSFKGGHDVSAGLRMARNRQQEDYADLIDGVPDQAAAVLGTGNLARTTRYQLFVQDDWRINRSLALGMGLSGEHRVHDIDEGAAQHRSSFTVWSPSMHIAKKLNGNSKHQLRLSLARTFQPPTISQMLLRPQINQLAPCYPQRPCVANTFDTADTAGNPWLQPERSRGVNLSYTHGMGAASEFGVEVYTRDIGNKIGSQIKLEQVRWSSVPRYVVRSTNLGQATVRGMDLTARVAMRDLWKTAPALNLSGSLGVAHSEVHDIAGSDNRVDGQLPWRAKVAASYAAVDLPLKLNLDAHYLPAEWIRSSDQLRSYQSSRFTFNANASWTFKAGPSLVLGVEDLGARDRRSVNEYLAGQQILHLFATQSSQPRLTFRLDITL